MSPLLLRLVCLPFLLTTTILATTPPSSPQSPPPSNLHTRQTPGSPGIIAKVLSPNGTDITSGFQTLFYHPADTDGGINSSPNINNRDLDGRQMPRVERAITSCRRPISYFRYSSCDYRTGHPNSMQRYMVVCSVPSRGRHSQGTRLITEFGACNPDEICVNGPRNSLGQTTTAHCVGQRSFEPIPAMNLDTQLGRDALHQYLIDRMFFSSVVVSESDKATAMSVQKLELDAGVAGIGRVGGQVGPTSELHCENCVDLTSGVLDNGTDFLMAEATVASVAAGVGMAGVIWLAAMSG